MALSTGWRDSVAVVLEPTYKTLTSPVAADIIRPIAAPRAYQAIDNLISQERLNDLSVYDMIRDASSPGEVSFSTYLKANGTAGTPIAAGYRACLKGVFGRETVTGGVNVTYNLLRIDQDVRSSYSVFQRFGDGMVLQNAGFLFNMVDINIRKRGQESLLQATFSGPFARQYWAGKSVTAGVPTATTLPLAAGTAKYFSAGAYITVTGFTPNPVQITSINYGTDTLTVPTLSGSPGAGVVVTGWYPTPAADTAFIISGWRGVATLGGTTLLHREVDFHLDNKIEIVDDVRDGTAYPSDFLEGADKREVSMRINKYFDSTLTGGMADWYNADQQVQSALIVPVGDVAGRIFTLNGPKAQLQNTPEHDTSGRVTVNTQYRLLATSGNDEVSFILT